MLDNRSPPQLCSDTQTIAKKITANRGRRGVDKEKKDARWYFDDYLVRYNYHEGADGPPGLYDDIVELLRNRAASE